MRNRVQCRGQCSLLATFLSVQADNTSALVHEPTSPHDLKPVLQIQEAVASAGVLSLPFIPTVAETPFLFPKVIPEALTSTKRKQGETETHLHLMIVRDEQASRLSQRLCRE